MVGLPSDTGCSHNKTVSPTDIPYESMSSWLLKFNSYQITVLCTLSSLHHCRFASQLILALLLKSVELSFSTFPSHPRAPRAFFLCAGCLREKLTRSFFCKCKPTWWTCGLTSSGLPHLTSQGPCCSVCQFSSTMLLCWGLQIEKTDCTSMVCFQSSVFVIKGNNPTSITHQHHNFRLMTHGDWWRLFWWRWTTTYHRNSIKEQYSLSIFESNVIFWVSVLVWFMTP